MDNRWSVLLSSKFEGVRGTRLVRSLRRSWEKDCKIFATFYVSVCFHGCKAVDYQQYRNF